MQKKKDKPMLHYLRNFAKIINQGIKFRISNRSFIIIKGMNLYYIYKRYEKTVIYVDNIRC